MWDTAKLACRLKSARIWSSAEKSEYQDTGLLQVHHIYRKACYDDNQATEVWIGLFKFPRDIFPHLS